MCNATQVQRYGDQIQNQVLMLQATKSAVHQFIAPCRRGTVYEDTASREEDRDLQTWQLPSQRSDACPPHSPDSHAQPAAALQRHSAHRTTPTDTCSLATRASAHHSRSSTHQRAVALPLACLRIIPNNHTGMHVTPNNTQDWLNTSANKYLPIPQKHAYIAACLSLDSDTQLPHFTTYSQERCVVSQTLLFMPATKWPGPRAKKAGSVGMVTCI